MKSNAFSEEDVEDLVLQIDPGIFHQELDIKTEMDISDVEPEMDISDVKPEVNEEDSLVDDPKLEETCIDISDSEDDSSESFFHCPFCSFKTASQLKMGEHVIDNHEKPKDVGKSRARSNRLFSCQICCKKYQTTVTLEQHYKKDHPKVILVVQGIRK